MDSFSDLAFFRLLLQKGTMASTAQEMGITPPSVSKRLAMLEQRLGVRLLQRTTRRMSLTPEGELYLEEGRRLLEKLHDLEHAVTGAKAIPRGLVRISATLGFGRERIAPVLSKFVQKFPQVQTQLHLTSQPVNIVKEGYDILIHFGDLPDSRLTARKLASNRRILCAAPSYLEDAGVPTSPKQLQQHDCIILRESDEAFGVWHLRRKTQQETIKVNGTLSSNDGACVLSWALDGHGIMMRSEWEVAPYIRSGQLRAILTEWSSPPADIHLVYPTKANLTAKTRVLIDFLMANFAKYRDANFDASKW